MRPRKFPRLAEVRVIWIDSTYDDGWHYLTTKKAPPLSPIVTTGFITGCHHDSIEVSSTMGAERGRLNPLRIPWGCIKSVKVVEGR